MGDKRNGRHVYDPERAVDTTIAFVEEQMQNPFTGIKILLPGIQDKLDPLKIGDLLGILAYTSNGKTSFTNNLVDQYAHVLKSYIQQREDYKHIIAWFGWEQPIEHMIGVDLSRVTGIKVSDILYGRVNMNQLTQLKESGVLRKSLPVWLVGHSVYDDRDRPLLSMADVADILTFIEEEAGYVVDLVILDYLQRIRLPVSDRIEGVMRNCDDARTLALKSPVILLSQARRECFERSWSMPLLSESLWSSNFEQSCTHIHGLWRPTQNKLERIKVGGQNYTVMEKMILHEVLKQTLGPINITTVYEMGYGGTYLKVWGDTTPVSQFSL